MDENILIEKRKKRAEYMRKWNREHPDSIKACNDKRKDNVKLWRRKNYEEHAEELKKKSREYYYQNRFSSTYKIKSKENTNKWIQNNLERYRECRRLAARKRYAIKLGVGGSGISLDEWLNMCKENNYRCSYCGKNDKLEIEHVVPISMGGLHDMSNIVPACRSCNRSKKSKSLLMFLYYRHQQYEHIRT